MEVGDTRRSRRRSSLDKAKEHLSQCKTPSIPVNDLIAAISAIHSNTTPPTELLLKLKPLFQNDLRTAYHSSFESGSAVLSAVATIVEHIIVEVLPTHWDSKIREETIHRGGKWGFLEDKVGDGRAWELLLLSILDGIYKHLEHSIESDENDVEVKDQKNRSMVGEALQAQLALILFGSNSWRLPLEVTYLAYDIVIEIITKHCPNKNLYRNIITAPKLCKIILRGHDRSVSEKALELAYRLMPPSTNKVDRKAWLLSLFPVDVFEDYKSPRDKFDKMKSVEYFTCASEILHVISQKSLTRAQPFTTPDISYNGILFLLSLDAPALVEWAVSRDVVSAKIEYSDEEQRFWFGLEIVEKVTIQVQAEETVVTFFLLSPATLTNVPIVVEGGTSQNIAIFRLTKSEDVDLLKRTLTDRAQAYTSLTILISTSPPILSDVVTNNSSSNNRRASHAGPILPSQPFVPVPNSDDIYPSLEILRLRDSNGSNGNNNATGAGQENATSSKKRGQILADIAEIQSRSTSNAGSRSSKAGSRDDERQLITRKLEEDGEGERDENSEVEVVAVKAFRKSKGKGKEIIKSSKTPGGSKIQDVKKTPVEQSLPHDPSRNLDAPRKPSNANFKGESKEENDLTPSQQRLQDTIAFVNTQMEEGELSDLEEEVRVVVTLGTIIPESSPPPITVPVKSRPTGTSTARSSKAASTKSSKANEPSSAAQKKLSPPPASKKRQTRNSAASYEESSGESLKQSDLQSKNAKATKGKGKKEQEVEIEKETTVRNKRKANDEIPEEDSLPQTRSRVVIPPVDTEIASIQKGNQSRSPSPIAEEVVAPLPKKRRRLQDPSPIDPHATTATTLVISDEVPLPSTLEEKKDAVSPKHTYGKEKKQRKGAAKPIGVKDKIAEKSKAYVVNLMKPVVEEAEEEAEEVEDEQEEMDEIINPDSVEIIEQQEVVKSSRESPELDEILGHHAPGYQKVKLSAKKPTPIIATSTRLEGNQSPSKSRVQGETSVSLRSKKSTKASANVTQIVEVAKTKDTVPTSKSSEVTGKLVKRTVDKAVKSVKTITSFAELIAEPDSRQINRKVSHSSHADDLNHQRRAESSEIDPVLRKDQSKHPELLTTNGHTRSPSILSIADAQIIPEEQIIVAQPNRLDTSMNGRAGNIRKSADLVGDDSDHQDLLSSKGKGKGVDRGNRRLLSDSLADLNSVNLTSKSMTALSKALASTKATEKTLPKSTRVRDITPPPPIPVASTSKQVPINSKVIAPKPPRKLAEELVRKLSDATSKSTTTTIPRSSGNQSKSKYILPHKPVSKGKQQQAKVAPVDDHRMQVDDESSESESEVLPEDEEIQSVLADLVEIIAAKSRERSDRQAVAFQRSVAYTSKKASKYMDEIHALTGEIVASSRALQVQREQNVIESRRKVEKLLASSNAIFEKIINL